MDRFTKDGRWIVPLTSRISKKDNKDEHNIRYVIDEVYCPNGCSLIDNEHKINNASGIRIRFKRPVTEGEFICSPKVDWSI